MAEVLNLPVHSAVEFKHTVLTHNADIAGFVDKLVICLVERILNKGGRSSFGVIVIAKRKNRAADADFALRALLHGRAVLIEKKDTIVFIGQAYRQNSAVLRLFRHNMVGA